MRPSTRAPVGKTLGGVQVAHVDAQAPRRVSEQRVGLHELELDGADLATARILHDVATERLREQLVPEADAERRRAGRDEGAQTLLGVENPGVARRDARGRSGDDERRELADARPLALLGIERARPGPSQAPPSVSRIISANEPRVRRTFSTGSPVTRMPSGRAMRRV